MNLTISNGIWQFKISGFRFLLILFLLCYITTFCYSQQSSVKDSTELAKKIQNKQIKYHYLVDFYSSFALTQLLNSRNKNDKGSLYFYYNATIAADLYYKKIAFNSFYTTDFGVAKYFDSLAIIQADQYNFKNSFSYKLGNSKFAVNFMLLSRSQYYNQYNYSFDSTGSCLAIPKSSYKSPGYRILSGGMKYSTKSFSVELGIVNCLYTLMKNQKYYDILNTNNLYGLEKGKKSKLDYGFVLIISVPIHKIYPNIYYENFSQVKIIKDDLTLINRYCFDTNQALHFIFLKHFRLSLRTKINYDYRISLKPNIINNVALGFYFHNSM